MTPILFRSLWRNKYYTLPLLSIHNYRWIAVNANLCCIYSCKTAAKTPRLFNVARHSTVFARIFYLITWIIEHFSCAEVPSVLLPLKWCSIKARQIGKCEQGFLILGMQLSRLHLYDCKMLLFMWSANVTEHKSESSTSENSNLKSSTEEHPASLPLILRPLLLRCWCQLCIRERYRGVALPRFTIYGHQNRWHERGSDAWTGKPQLRDHYCVPYQSRPLFAFFSAGTNIQKYGN